MRKFIILVLVASCGGVEAVVTTLAPTTTTIPMTTTSSIPRGLVMAQLGEGYDRPTQLVFSPNGVLWVVEQGGRVSNLDGDLLMDLEWEAEHTAGLLGLVFDPDWPHTDRIWYYAVDPATRVGGVYEVMDGKTSMRRLWESAPDHYGGHLELHDSWLYVAVGDGGGGPLEAFARHPDLERGSVFRYDINLREWEVVATGFRNPWGWTIHDDWLYVGDVGEGLFEEINVTRIETGGDFGWPFMEGPECLMGECVGLESPAIAYTHDDGCGVVVGPVFEGSWLGGALLWTDLCRGDIRASWFADGEETVRESWPTPNWITTIAASDGVIYLAGLDGRVYSATPVG